MTFGCGLTCYINASLTITPGEITVVSAPRSPSRPDFDLICPFTVSLVFHLVRSAPSITYISSAPEVGVTLRGQASAQVRRGSKALEDRASPQLKDAGPKEAKGSMQSCDRSSVGARWSAAGRIARGAMQAPLPQRPPSSTVACLTTVTSDAPLGLAASATDHHLTSLIRDPLAIYKMSWETTGDTSLFPQLTSRTTEHKMVDTTRYVLVSIPGLDQSK